MSESRAIMQDALEVTTYLTQVTPAHFALLQKAAPQARLWGEEAVQLFYDTAFGHERTAAIFTAGERAAREQTLRVWYLALLDVADPAVFWERQVRIALAHIRRRVHNEYMIGMAELLEHWFLKQALAAFGPAEGLATAQAFNRVLDSVVGLTCAGYDALQRLAIQDVTGAEPELLKRLIQKSVAQVQAEYEEISAS